MVQMIQIDTTDLCKKNFEVYLKNITYKSVSIGTEVLLESLIL